MLSKIPFFCTSAYMLYNLFYYNYPDIQCYT